MNTIRISFIKILELEAVPRGVRRARLVHHGRVARERGVRRVGNTRLFKTPPRPMNGAAGPQPVLRCQRPEF